MKILITGENSYIGHHLREYLKEQGEEYEVDTISVRNEAWNQVDFSKYDTIIHLAAIVHRNPHKISQEIYMKVNYQLPIRIAEKAKLEHVKQFVFLSTMAVYGVEGKINKKIVIDKDTPCKPVSKYGKSKRAAEEGLLKLKDSEFIVSIIRPPMVYGPKCVGNYSRLSNLVKKIGIFPVMDNERSMVYITNLCECIHLVIDTRIVGILHPQDQDYMNTTNLVLQIAYVNQVKIRKSNIMGWVIRYIGRYVPICNKIFGNLVYDFKLDHLNVTEYAKVNFKEAVMQTESIS